MVANTSILSYQELKKSGQDIREWEYVFNLLNQVKTPMNSREISNHSGIERTNITRTLSDLKKEGKIIIAKSDKCRTTGKLTDFYT